MSPDSIGNVEFLTRLLRSFSELETSLRLAVPEGVRIKCRRGAVSESCPGDKSYDYVLATFKEDVSSNQSVTLLSFLYEHEMYLSKSMQIFASRYRHYFSERPRKWNFILSDFPKLDQTTISTILAPISETVVGYRLEDLARIGLVERTDLSPPRSKYVRITSKGIATVDAALGKARISLAPVFEVGLSSAVKATEAAIVPVLPQSAVNRARQ